MPSLEGGIIDAATLTLTVVVIWTDPLPHSVHHSVSPPSPPSPCRRQAEAQRHHAFQAAASLAPVPQTQQERLALLATGKLEL